MSLPKIKVEKTIVDKSLDISTAVVLLSVIVLIGITYNQLPAKIPINFNWPSMGADGLGKKSELWASPIIHAVICIGIYFLNKFPWLFNYPVKINVENAPYHYRQSTKMLRVLTLVIALLSFRGV